MTVGFCWSDFCEFCVVWLANGAHIGRNGESLGRGGGGCHGMEMKLWLFLESKAVIYYLPRILESKRLLKLLIILIGIELNWWRSCLEFIQLHSRSFFDRVPRLSCTYNVLLNLKFSYDNFQLYDQTWPFALALSKLHLFSKPRGRNPEEVSNQRFTYSTRWILTMVALNKILSSLSVFLLKPSHADIVKQLTEVFKANSSLASNREFVGAPATLFAPIFEYGCWCYSAFKK